MLPILPQKWVFNDRIPFQESNLVEFKEVSIFSGLFKNRKSKISALPKYRETITGFINGGQGYLIMGVKNDGTIVGVQNMTDESIDKFKLWLDGSFNSLVYKDGKPIDPSKISITFKKFPVENTSSNVIVIEVINKGTPMDVMTRSGTIVYRLNASNFKISSEPVYRKRDVRGMIQSIQTQMNQSIKDLQEKHQEKIKNIIMGQEKEFKNYVDKISDSLYDKYRIEDPKESLCLRLVKWLYGLY